MVRCLAWNSNDTSPRLTTDEVNELFVTTYQFAKCGELSNGKYIGASRALYWVRLKEQ